MRRWRSAFRPRLYLFAGTTSFAMRLSVARRLARTYSRLQRSSRPRASSATFGVAEVSDVKSRVDDERVRLESALNRLENAFRGISEKAGQQVGALKKDNARLTAELSELRRANEEMSGRLNAVQAEYRALTQSVDQVTQRLDVTIDQLKIVLEG